MHFPLLADGIPNWTDKEVLIALGSAAGTVISVSLFALRVITAGARRRARVLAKENQELREKLQATAAPAPQMVEELHGKLRKSESDLSELTATIEQERVSAATAKTDLEAVRTALEEHTDSLAAERRRVDKAMDKDGRIWAERVLSGVPEFKPLEPDGRRMPVISVLNLKGGVGKTTMTANVGAALDARGYRTLLLDLDLQGSLTGLFIPEGEQHELYVRKKLLGTFLASSFDAEHPSLLDYIRPIQPDAESALVPTADEMAYAEMNLTLRWLLRDTRRDPRFLLRKELQLRRITNNFDIVLLDCPPLINVCCVNALAASDYVLVPILPSKQATARVPVLLQRLKEFRDNINPALKVMGIVCNRTHRTELTADEENRLTTLQSLCFDVWGEEVKQFDTFVRQSREVRVAEDDRRPLGQGDEMFEVFAALAEEVESRLPMFCRPAARSSPAQEVLS